MFNDDVSGRYGEPYLYDNLHRNYNRSVTELWNKKKYNPSKMTKADAEDFIRLVMNSKDPEIARFRDEIRKSAGSIRSNSSGRPKEEKVNDQQ